MQVRQYREGDESAIARVYNLGFERQINSLPAIYQFTQATPEDVLDWLLQGSNTFWVIEEEGRIIGYAQVRVHIEDGNDDVPVLQFMPARKWDLNESNIAILPKYQKKGVASHLIRIIIETYKLDIEVITAHTFSDNVAAERLFSSLGFEMCDVYYYSRFSENRPLANSSIYETLTLNQLQKPKMKFPEIEFRRAELRDADILRKIHVYNVFWCDQCRTIEWNRDFIRGTYGHVVFVAEAEGQLIGAIDYYRDGRIGIAGLLPEYRGKGYGSAMFYEILREMRAVGFDTAFVDSGLTQTDAIKMYERFNFKIQRRQNCWVKALDGDGKP